MATAMTFSSLQDDVRAYLERGYPTDETVYAQIPRLINLAERAIARALKIQGFITPVIATLQAGVNVYAKPDRWRKTVSMNYAANTTTFLANELGETLDTETLAGILLEQNSRISIFARSYEYCRAFWPDATQVAPPKFYADYDYLHWVVVPTPDVNYPWEVLYYELPALLDNTTQTNWLTDFAPNALLYRTLLEATPFLKNDERVAVWQQFYQEEMSGLANEDLQRVVDRTSVRKED